VKLSIRTMAAIAGVVLIGTSFAATPEELIASNKCNKCHSATTTKKAPSFAAIAEKYKGQADAQDKLVNTLKTGANEHDKVAASDADLKAIAAFVLSAK
jgi:cytochrome c